MQRAPSIDLRESILRPSPEEVHGTHILFHARHATDSSPERHKLYGYPVIEHAVILETLRGLGFKVTAGSDPQDLLDPLDYDFIFTMHTQASFEGHELFAGALAAFRGIPFLGAPAPIRAIAEDKVLGKHVAASIGLDVAEHHLISPLRPGMADFSLPGRWIVKPRGGCDSVAVTLVEGQPAWRDALAAAANPKNEGRDFIAEAFVPGINLTVPVIEGLPAQSLAVFEEHGREGDNILDQAGKIGKSASYSSEPYFGPGAEQASAAAARMAAALSPFDYARFDFRYDPDAGRLVFLEGNVVCSLGPATVVARAAGLGGIDYPSLIGHLVTRSLRRQRMEF
jgi:D-alanine-D-alanine ligase